MKYKYFYFNTFIILILIMIFIYTISWSILIILITYISCYYASYKNSSIILLLLISVTFLFNWQTNDVKINNEWNHHIAVVENVYSSSITVKENGDRYYIMKVEQPVSKGDIIEYNTPYYSDLKKGSFDIFYKSTKAIGYGYANDLNIIVENQDYRSRVHDNLYQDGGWYSEVTLLMLYGEEKGVGTNLKRKVNTMGISHLFVVSGFHISLLFVFFNYILSHLTSNNGLKLTISTIFSLLFLYLIYFPPTGIRALLTLVIINLTHNSKVNSLSITGIIMFIFNPWLLLSSSMVLSFSITYAIYLFEPNRRSIVDMLLLSMFAFYISLPTISTWEDTHNLLGPLLSIVMTPIVSIVYVMSLVMMPFDFMYPYMDVIYKQFYILIDITSKIYIPFNFEVINITSQFVLICLTVYYVAIMKEHRLTSISSFFSISMLLFLI